MIIFLSLNMCDRYTNIRGKKDLAYHVVTGLSSNNKTKSLFTP